ncbi:MAG: ATPase [Oscillospiraceae bacterium]|nr:ATPase [Oscillospiraceae bacterium]
MRFAAGVDGGGTRTTVECRTMEGAALCREVFGPFNLNSVGEERFTALLEEIAAFLGKTGECAALCIGAAGVSNPRVRELTARVMDGVCPWRLAGDHEIALHGAHSGGPGLALIAGTGSICCGKNERGEAVRAGGWGHLVDDGGSGYALGRDLLSAVVRQWDGRGEETVLTRLLLARLEIETPQELVAYVYGGDKSRVASLAPLAGQAAAQGDRTALDIYARNGAELGELVLAAAKRLGMETGEVALLGGLLTGDGRLREALTAWLAERAPGLRCIEPRQDAAAGAAMLALELAAEAGR